MTIWVLETLPAKKGIIVRLFDVKWVTTCYKTIHNLLWFHFLALKLYGLLFVKDSAWGKLGFLAGGRPLGWSTMDFVLGPSRRGHVFPQVGVFYWATLTLFWFQNGPEHVLEHPGVARVT